MTHSIGVSLLYRDTAVYFFLTFLGFFFFVIVFHSFVSFCVVGERLSSSLLLSSTLIFSLGLWILECLILKIKQTFKIVSFLLVLISRSHFVSSSFFLNGDDFAIRTPADFFLVVCFLTT